MARTLTAEKWLQVGVNKHRNGLLEDAMYAFNQAILIDPKIADGYIGRAKINADLKDYISAMADYDQAVVINPKDPLILGLRGAQKFYIGELIDALADFNQAIWNDPGFYSGYASRGSIYQALGDIYQAQLDFNRFLYLTTRFVFFELNTGPFSFYSIYPAPYLLFRSFEKFTEDFEQFNTIDPIVDTTRQQCRHWKRWEEWRKLSGSQHYHPISHYHALALVNYYMGDCIESFRIYKEVLDDEDIMGIPLNLMGLYYYIESAKLFRQEYEIILEDAVEQIEETKVELISQNALRELYYAGQILWANDQVIEAHEFFEQADDYLPAAYMQILTLQTILADDLEIEAKIAEIRRREASLQPTSGFLQGFPMRPFRLEKPLEDFQAPVLHYAHYREIAQAITEVRDPDQPFQHNEIWNAFYWLPEDEKDLDWLLRREELAQISKSLLEKFRINVETQLDGKADAEIAAIEKGFSDIIKKDDWDHTKYNSFDDFKAKASTAPDLAQQLALIISDNRRLGAYNKMQLVEYCYLRGDLMIEDVFLMYFYIIKHNQTASRDDVAEKGLVNMNKKIIQLLFNPLSIPGQVLTAAVAGALTELLKKFSARSNMAPDIDKRAATGNLPIKPSDYDRFVEDFLQYLSYEREKMGKKAFEKKYPLEGFEDRKQGRPVN